MRPDLTAIAGALDLEPSASHEEMMEAIARLRYIRGVAMAYTVQHAANGPCGCQICVDARSARYPACAEVDHRE